MLSSKAPLGGPDGYRDGGETCRGHGARAMEQNHKSFNHTLRQAQGKDTKVLTEFPLLLANSNLFHRQLREACDEAIPLSRQ